MLLNNIQYFLCSRYGSTYGIINFWQEEIIYNGDKVYDTLPILLISSYTGHFAEMAEIHLSWSFLLFISKSPITE